MDRIGGWEEGHETIRPGGGQDLWQATKAVVCKWTTAHGSIQNQQRELNYRSRQLGVCGSS